MEEKKENAKRMKKKKDNKKKKLIITMIIADIILITGICFAIIKWQNAKQEENKPATISRSIYSDMTSKQMYEATRQLEVSEKRQLVEMFIQKWKQDKRANIDTIADNETHARYLFCI